MASRVFPKISLEGRVEFSLVNTPELLHHPAILLDKLFLLPDELSQLVRVLPIFFCYLCWVHASADIVWVTLGLIALFLFLLRLFWFPVYAK